MLFDETEHVERVFEFELPAGPTLESEEEASKRLLQLRLFGWEKVGGDIVWRGARLLAAELLRRNESLRGARVLELGAGTGLLAALSAHLGAHALITDGDEREVPLLMRNAELFSDDLALGGSLAAAQLEWGTATAEALAEAAEVLPGPPLRRGGFDLVIGSDIAYMPDYIPALAETIAFFLDEAGEALIANTAVATNTTHPKARALFLESLGAVGLDAEVEEPLDGPTFKAVPEVEWPKVSYFLRIRHRGK